MTSVAPIYNKACVRCRHVELKMFQVGALVFCSECYGDVFKTEDPVYNERDVYLRWVEEAKKKEQKESP